MRSSYVRLMVDDFTTSFLFYRDVMKLKVVYGHETSRYAEFDMESGTHLAVNQRQVMAEALGTVDQDHTLPGQDRFALIFEVDDVDKSSAELVEAGAHQVSPPREWPGWGIYAAHFRDPDGYLIELNRPL